MTKPILLIAASVALCVLAACYPSPPPPWPTASRTYCARRVLWPPPQCPIVYSEEGDALWGCCPL